MAVHCQLFSVLEAREWAKTGQLYAILDACDTPSIPLKAETLGEQRAVSLYRGSAEEELGAIAPYLVSVDPELFDWIAGTLWSKPWGIFARSDASFHDLRTHFRRFLLVKSPTGEEWYFRYYDPRILDRYLPTCTEDELGEFFGTVSSFAVVDPDSYGVKLIAKSPLPTGEARAPIRIQFKRPARSE